MKSYSAGRTLRSLDQLDKVTTVTYDAGGNQLTVRDPNSVGANMVYDSLGRNTQRTDTFGDVTKTDYDNAGNALKQTDAKKGKELGAIPVFYPNHSTFLTHGFIRRTQFAIVLEAGVKELG